MRSRIVHGGTHLLVWDFVPVPLKDTESAVHLERRCQRRARWKVVDMHPQCVYISTGVYDVEQHTHTF